MRHGATWILGALAAVADALSRNTRGGDFGGRYADDEFVVLLPDLDGATTRDVADRLATVCSAGGSPGDPVITMGMATARPHATPETLFAAADAALTRVRRQACPGLAVVA